MRSNGAHRLSSQDLGPSADRARKEVNRDGRRRHGAWERRKLVWSCLRGRHLRWNAEGERRARQIGGREVNKVEQFAPPGEFHTSGSRSASAFHLEISDLDTGDRPSFQEQTPHGPPVSSVSTGQAQWWSVLAVKREGVDVTFF